MQQALRRSSVLGSCCLSVPSLSHLPSVSLTSSRHAIARPFIPYLHRSKFEFQRTVAVTAAAKGVAQIRGKCSLDVPITTKRDTGAELALYMEQIAEFLPDLQLPLGGSLVRTAHDQFTLTVPRIQLFDVWLQPELPCTLTQGPGKVAIVSQRCDLTGSKQVEGLGLNDRVRLDAIIGFTWRQATEPGAPAPQKLSASGTLNIDVDIPPAFWFVPKGMTEMAGNTAINTTLRLMLATFVQTISQDYAKWAQSSELRAERQKTIAAKKLQEQQLKQRQKKTPTQRAVA